MSHAVPSVTNERMSAVLDWTKWIAQVLVVPLLAGCLAFALHVEHRMDQLELGQQSRFTAEDGLKVWERIAELQREIAVMSERLQTHLQQTVPAAELVRADRYADDRQQLERRITKIEAEVYP